MTLWDARRAFEDSIPVEIYIFFTAVILIGLFGLFIFSIASNIRKALKK